MVLPLEEHEEVSNTIQCPDCDHDIPINPDWQEEDTFTCPKCTVQLQVTGVNPLWVDFVPDKEDESWVEPDDEDDVDDVDEDEDDDQTLGLDEVEELEEEGDEDLDDDDWDEPVSRRVATLRSSRTRSPVRREVGQGEGRPVNLLTPEGAARLQEELEHLRTVRLPKVTAWLSDALAEGFEEEDVTELEEARSELSLIEGRIRKLEYILASAEILKEPESNECVQIGSRVTVVEGDYEPETYRIVSPAEADPLSGFISNVSPLGRALIGHQVGQVVTVASPDGPIEFRIVEIN